MGGPLQGGKDHEVGSVRDIGRPLHRDEKGQVFYGRHQIICGSKSIIPAGRIYRSGGGEAWECGERGKVEGGMEKYCSVNRC